MTRIQYIPNRVIDSNGISDGAEVYVYQSGTTTKVALWQDAGFTVPLLNPIPVPTGAEISPFYTSYVGNVRVRIVASDGTVPLDDDPYSPPAGLIDIMAINSKLEQIPATQDFVSAADLEESDRANFLMPDSFDLEVDNEFTKRFFGPGSVHLTNGDVPGWQGGAVHGFSMYYPGDDVGQQFAFVSKAWVGARINGGSAPGQNHVVGVYGEAARGAGSSAGVWAFNTVTNVSNLNGPTIGYEVDMNNLSGVDPGLNPAQAYYGLSIISGDEGRGGTAFAVDRNGDYPNNGWNRGIHIKEVYQRGIEFTNCGVATGIFTDTTMVFKALTDTSIVRFTPFNDANLTDPLLYLTNSANSLIVARWNKRGEIAIGGVGTQGMNSVGARQIANGDNILFLQRLTDSAPNGTFIRAVSADNSVNFFDVDFNIIAGETNVRLSVAGAASTRVSVGAADSGGSGYRVLRVPN